MSADFSSPETNCGISFCGQINSRTGLTRGILVTCCIGDNCEVFYELFRQPVVLSANFFVSKSTSNGNGDFPAFNPAEAGTQCSDPGVMQG